MSSSNQLPLSTPLNLNQLSDEASKSFYYFQQQMNLYKSGIISLEQINSDISCFQGNIITLTNNMRVQMLLSQQVDLKIINSELVTSSNQNIELINITVRSSKNKCEHIYDYSNGNIFCENEKHFNNLCYLHGAPQLCVVKHMNNGEYGCRYLDCKKESETEYELCEKHQKFLHYMYNKNCQYIFKRGNLVGTRCTLTRHGAKHLCLKHLTRDSIKNEFTS